MTKASPDLNRTAERRLRYAIRTPLACVVLACFAAPPLARSASTLVEGSGGVTHVKSGCRTLEVGLCGNGDPADTQEDGYSEECDEGDENLAPGDASPGECTNECKIAACGDGILNLGEVCDDGEDENIPAEEARGDACTVSCKKVECGNGEQTRGEACDDGNLEPNDGCEPDCTLTVCTSGNECGDGSQECDEACDDGNQEVSDACPSKCEKAFCGDGFLWSTVGGMEECDDGNDMAGDGCEADCTLTPGCGNGKLEEGEACDDGNVEDGDGCPSGAAGRCGEVASCGDGILWTIGGTEQCDDGNASDTDACVDICKDAVCGDGYVWAGVEACDAGGVQTAMCEADCATPACGDGVVNAAAGEGCDDGNKADGDGCSVDCKGERWVFTTSVLYKGNLNYAEDNPEMLEGIELADTRCNALAEGVGLTSTFKAWLSDGESSPATRFDTKFTGHYRLRSDEFSVVATGWPDLIDGTLAHPIDADEEGILTQENVLTNTAFDGTAASVEDHCSGWTKSDDTLTTVGKSTASDATWTNLVPSLCSNLYRIYCFEDL